MAEFLAGLLWVTAGSALGGMARFFVSGAVGRRIGETFPWGTMTVNVSGAFVIGLLWAAAGTYPLGEAYWQFAAVGFLGSYTTVSSLSLQTLALARDGEGLQATGNVIATLALGLGAVAAGYGMASAALGAGAP
jgi:CrcB protein